MHSSNFKIIKINKTILHFACEEGNLDIVKYLVSLDKIDIAAQSISYLFF